MAGCSLASVRMFEHGYMSSASPTRDRMLDVLASLEAEERQAA
jgi:hypothetical protein